MTDSRPGQRMQVLAPLLALSMLSAPALAQDGDDPTVSVRASAGQEDTVCGDQIPPPRPVRFLIDVQRDDPTDLVWQVSTSPEDGVLRDGRSDGLIDHPGGEATHVLEFALFIDDRYEPSQVVTLEVAYDDPALGEQEILARADIVDDDRLGVRRSEFDSVQQAVNRVSFDFLGLPPPELVLVSDEVFADGLAASFLGGSLQVTPPAMLHPDIRISRSVTIVGGPAAVSTTVEEQLRAGGAEDVVRIAGDDRFETARLVVAEGLRRRAESGAELPREALLASGATPTDAVAAAQLAGQGTPLLLTLPDALPQPTRTALAEGGYERVTIVGGEAVVGPAVEAELEALEIQVARLAGADRFESSTMLAALARRDVTDVWLVPSDDWRVPLSLGVAGNSHLFGCYVEGVVVYAPAASLDDAAALQGWLDSGAAPIGGIRLFGSREQIAPLVFEQVSRFVG